MSKGSDILERKVIHAGDVFIKAGEENIRAYVLQNGQARSFVMDGDKKIEVAKYGPGTIIGEVCLVLDEVMTMSYEALTDTTVVSITRQDFDKKMVRVDGSIKTILKTVMKKLREQDGSAIVKAQERAQIDDDAFALVQGILAGMDPDKKFRYEKAILPHANDLIKALKKLKTKDRHAAQTKAVEEKQAEITEAEA